MNGDSARIGRAQRGIRRQRGHQPDVPHTIESARLKLVSMGPELLRTLIAGGKVRAKELLGARFPDEIFELVDVLRMRLGQLEVEPADEPWLLRAVVLVAEARVIGVTGFHGRPGGEWLRDFAPDGVEFGYTIFEGDRRRGYAVEASEALVGWATEEHGVRGYVLSIAPENDASIGVARRLGFEEVGEWLHPERGRELVYLRTT